MILVIFLVIGALLVVGFPLLMIYFGIHGEDPALTMHQKTNTDCEAYEPEVPDQESLIEEDYEPDLLDDESMAEEGWIDGTEPIYEYSDPATDTNVAIFVKEWGEHYNLILTDTLNNDIHFNDKFVSYDAALARSDELLEELRKSPIDIK